MNKKHLTIVPFGVSAVRGAQASALLAVLAWGSPTYAQEEEGFIAPGTETFKIGLGGVFNEADTTLRLDSSSGRSGEVDLEDVAGLERNMSSVFLLANWRFAPNHRIGLQAFQVKRDATKTTSRDIQLRDSVIPAGTQLELETESRFVVVNYQYSFIHNDRLELAGIGGLYGARFKFSFNASSPPTDIDASTNAPLPMLGLSMDWFITPRWTVSALAEGLAVKVGDIEGRTYNVVLATDYMLTRHIGVGLGVGWVDLSLDVSKNEFKGHVDWGMKSFFAYLQGRF